MIKIETFIKPLMNYSDMYIGTAENIKYHRQKKRHLLKLDKRFQPSKEDPLSPEGFHGRLCPIENTSYQCIQIYPFEIPNSSQLFYDSGKKELSLPPDLGDSLGLDDRITIIGTEDHFELWHPEDWQSYRPRLNQNKTKELFNQIFRINS